MKTKHTFSAVKGESHAGARMLILDDDPIVSAVVKHHLRLEFPEVAIDTCAEAEARPGYDVYFLDNDFGGRQMAVGLLAEVRNVAPHALIVALSNTLDVDVMSRMMNGGCNAIYNKRDLSASSEARDVISTYLSIVSMQRSRAEGNSVSNVMSSMRQLIDSWNRRLSNVTLTADQGLAEPQLPGAK